MFPVASAVTRVHGIATLTVGAGGNAVFCMGPWGINDSGGTVDATLILANDAT